MLRFACLLAALSALPALAAQGFVPPGRQAGKADQDKKPAQPQTVVLNARIVDGAGQPIEGAGLALFKSSAAKDTHRCRTAPAGKSGADGKITLTIKRLASDRRTWLLAAKKRTSLVLRLRPTKTTEDGVEVYRADLGDVVMHEGVSVLGLVRDSDGKPVVGAKVVASGILGQVLANRRSSATHSTSTLR